MNAFSNYLGSKLSSMIGWHDIKGGASHIADMWNVVTPFRPKVGRAETFESAVQRVGADENSLSSNRKVFTLIYIIHTIACAVALALAIKWIAAGVHGGFAAIGFAAVEAALAITFGFRAWQIRERRLGGFADFLRGGK
jgi:hypothetical protein